VEYDRAAGVVQELIARCKPDAVVSFGQGGGSIDLEQTAYNLKDASNFPDNRGLVLEGAPIDAAGPAERATSLPLDKIEAALQAAGEAPQRSTDPGRYICNNVFFAESGAITARGFGQAGFIHLPYTSTFRAADRARFGKVVEQVVNAIAAS
jgi:pyroglutamyl-peptidase